MKNVFTGIEVTFPNCVNDNTEHNALFDREWFRQYLLPRYETNDARFLREVDGFLATGEIILKCARHTPDVTTFYLSGKITALFLSVVRRLSFMTSVTSGSMKEDGTFRTRKSL